MLSSPRNHWPEYLIEAWGLGTLMVLAGSFATLLFYPESPAYALVPNGFLRRMFMGILMGSSAIALIYSPWGKRSGAHMNPAVTLAFFRLGKLAPWDALFYILAQFIGGIVGITLIAMLVGNPFTHLPVNYIVTMPGRWGPIPALIAEFLMAFGLMSMVLVVSNHKRWSRFTGIFAGLMVATYITFVAPISGMSMNPARSFASALSAHVWTSIWIYYFTPPLAMLAAVEVYLRHTQANPRQLCGKLCPNAETPCLCTHCCCNYL
jgi:aquaporin Z